MQNQQFLQELFQAYYDCRKNKRNTNNAIAFELNYESNIISLRQDIITWKYEIWKSIAFIVNKPVKREIFAWDFRDRIVHHYLINKLNPYFETNFIHDSYSCRTLKWTLFWIKRIDKFIRSCSQNYQKNCYILKLDISWFFMNIDKDIISQKLTDFIDRKYNEEDKNIVLNLIQKVIENDPTKNCTIKWKREDWAWLPKSKTLFWTPENKWLPIGNLTSQIFANFYLDFLDKFIKKELKIKHYWRYVDDFVIIHQDKQYLKSLIPKIRDFLKNSLKLKLHPNKIYLQHFSKWVQFLWALIKPRRIYAWPRLKWNFYKAIQKFNKFFHSRPVSRLEVPVPLLVPVPKFLSSINSFLWLMKHFNTYLLRKKFLTKHISSYFWNYFYISSGYCKVVLRRRVIS